MLKSEILTTCMLLLALTVIAAAQVELTVNQGVRPSCAKGDKVSDIYNTGK